MVLVTHNRELADRADRILELDDGVLRREMGEPLGLERGGKDEL
jgi:ABC-type lipoprotein export system ATPase subunit